jgi:MoxR-like ATPase
MKTAIGYPDHSATVRILEGTGGPRGEVVEPVVDLDAVRDMIAVARTVHVDPVVTDYVARLVEATRTNADVRLGASVRGALALMRCSKTFAAINGRHYVVPDDVKALAEPVLAHRLGLDPESEFDGVTAGMVVAQVLAETPPPSDRVAV